MNLGKVSGPDTGPRGPGGKRLLLGSLATVGVLAGQQVGQVQSQVLLEVGRSVETTVLVTDDDADLGRVAARSGLPGLQTDAVVGLAALDLEGLGEDHRRDDVAVGGVDGVGSLAKGNSHGDS